MPSSSTTHGRGFTLIELLVVLFIASLTAGLLVINISFDTAEDKIQQEAKRLHALLRFAHEQAIIRAEEYGVRFHQTGYRFMILEDNEWIDLGLDRHLVAHELDNNMEVELFIEDINVTLNDAEDEADLIKEQQLANSNNDNNEDDEDNISRTKNVDDEKQIKPQIFLLSSGELTPDFSGRFRIPGLDYHAEVQGTLNGQYKLLKAEDE